MDLETWRCPTCNRILAKVALQPGSAVQVKCKCNCMSTLIQQNTYRADDSLVQPSPLVDIPSFTSRSCGGN